MKVCFHHWIFRGPRLRECRDCGQFEERLANAKECEPCCPALVDAETDLRRYCDACGNVWEKQPVTEVERDGTPIRTIMAWAVASVWVTR